MAQWSTRINQVIFGKKSLGLGPILVLHWAMDVIYDFYNKKAMEQEWFRWSDQYLQMQSRHSKHLAVSRTIEVVKIKVTFDL